MPGFCSMGANSTLMTTRCPHNPNPDFIANPACPFQLYFAECLLFKIPCSNQNPIACCPYMCLSSFPCLAFLTSFYTY